MNTKKKILSIKVLREHDTDPDTSYFGTYSKNPGPDNRTIDRVARGDCGRHEYPYFIASAKDTGNPESVEQDYQRMEALNRGAWCFIGIQAVAEVQLGSDVVQDLNSGGLWGIESDSDESYLRSIEHEQLAELANELQAVGFSDKAIEAAIKDSCRKVGAA